MNTNRQKGWTICGVITLMALIVFPINASTTSAADIIGHWVTYDDNSGEKRSIVSITEKDGKLHGRIVKVFFKPDDETKCVKCKGEKHNQDIIGLEIFGGLSAEESIWQNGKILDPENGKEYKCKLWLEGDDVMVRGYIAFFYRTQTWKRHQE